MLIKVLISMGGKMNELMVFNNKDFGGIRAINIDGLPWFIGKDVAQVLGYEAERNALKQHVDEEDKLTHQISASGQMRNMVIINESGLYSLILASKLPKAKEFRRWVTSEVLPSIRQNGGYINGGELDYLVKTVVAQTTTAVISQLPDVISETVKSMLDTVPEEGRRPQINPLDWNEIAYWEGVLAEWRNFRMNHSNKEQADKDFLASYREKYPSSKIGRRTLYRKWHDYTEKGSTGLIDMRGRHGNHRKKITVTVEVDDGAEIEIIN